MFKKIALAAAVLPALLAGAPAFAGGPGCDLDAITEKLPGVDREKVASAAIDGLCEIALGPQIVYVSNDARYLVRGDIIDLESNLNMTDQRRNSARADMMKTLDVGDMIVFEPKEVKHTITVFTDIDCGYCRKLHREMGDLNQLGVKVQYMFFPRSGPNTASWKKAEDVWCSADRNSSLTRAKNGEAVTADACDAPIDQQYEVGQMVGLRGTPAIITESGDLISGYLPAASLVSRIQSLKTASAKAF